MRQARDREGFQTWDRRGTERDFRHGTGEKQRGISDVGQARGFRRGTGEGQRGISDLRYARDIIRGTDV